MSRILIKTWQLSILVLTNGMTAIGCLSTNEVVRHGLVAFSFVLLFLIFLMPKFQRGWIDEN